MFGRSFFALSALVLFVGITDINAAAVKDIQLKPLPSKSQINVDELIDLSIENDNAIIDEILKILQEFFGEAAENCLKEAAKECKKHWYSPKKLVKCARDYFHNHSEECAVSRVQLLDVSIENDNAIIDAILEVLKKFFVNAAENCLKEAANKCKKYWYNPKKLVNCAKDYFKENEGDCAIPEVRTDLEISAIENDNAIIDAILEILKKFFVNAAENCLKEAANKCKKYWYNPKKLVNCAKEYFKENEGDCAIPEVKAESELLIENDNAIIDEIIEILKEFFVEAAENCLKQAANKCKKYWYNPKKLVNCAKDYFKENIEECGAAEFQTKSLAVAQETEAADLTDEDVENRNAIIDAILEILKEFFVGAAENCLKQAANKCKKYWYNPKKLVNCAKDYFKENIEECGAAEFKSLDAEKEIQIDGSFDLAIEEDNAIIDAILEVLKKFFVNAAENCLKEAANECKKYWYNPKKLVKCAKEYFKENEGDCAIPEY